MQVNSADSGSGTRGASLPGPSSRDGGPWPGLEVWEFPCVGRGLVEEARARAGDAPEGATLIASEPDGPGTPSGDGSAGVIAADSLVRAGSAFLVSDARRMALAHEGILALSAITKDREWAFAVGLIGLFHLWAVDLPASEKFHHSGPWGLAEHSLEVAVGVVGDLERRWRSLDPEGGLSPGERALWARVSFALGLFHDVGKVRDVEVRAHAGCAAWNPLEEPLAFYRNRWGVTGSVPTPVRYRAGRGLRGHEARSIPLIRRMVRGTIGEALRPFLQHAFWAYSLRYRVTAGVLPGPLEYLTALVVEADRNSTVENRSRTSMHPPPRTVAFSK